MEQPIKVYVISDPLAINFLVDDDIDGFKEYLDSDDMLDFPEPEVFETERQALADFSHRDILFSDYNFSQQQKINWNTKPPIY